MYFIKGETLKVPKIIEIYFIGFFPIFHDSK